MMNSEEIQIVINIPKKLYNRMKNYHGLDDTYMAVKRGISFDDVLDKIRAEIEQVADKAISNCYGHIQMENAYRHSLSVIDKYNTDCLARVLGKIRAEILNITDGDTPERIWNVDVLEIIDKYKAEVDKQERSEVTG